MNKFKELYKENYLTTDDLPDLYNELSKIKREIKIQNEKSKIYVITSLSLNLYYSRKVKQFDKNGKLIFTFNSIKGAAKVNSTSPTMIARCCNGLKNEYKGFTFKFA